MININVEGGTAKLGENLCINCTHAHHIEMANGQEKTKCMYADRWVESAVLRCSSYQHKNAPSLYNMEKIAWTISGDPKGKMGFAQPPDPNKKNDLLGDIL